MPALTEESGHCETRGQGHVAVVEERSRNELECGADPLARLAKQILCFATKPKHER